jgi:hypothetical protein
VARLIADLRWLAEQVRAVQTTDPRQGFRREGFPWEKWDECLERTREVLARFAE